MLTVLTRRQCVLMLGASFRAAEERKLYEEWRRIAKTTDGTMGVAALYLPSGELVSLNGDERFPLASVCKIPIAMNILALVDEGKLALDQQIEVLPRDVWAGVSEIEKRWPAERRFRLDEMIDLMVSKSDNTVVETLFRIGGGEQAIAKRLSHWNIEGVRVDRSERQCARDRNGVVRYPPADEWTDRLLENLMDKTPLAKRYRATLRYLADPRDTGTPNGTVRLLSRRFQGEMLSKLSTTRLIESLKATTTFPTRLKGLLPPGTVVAHKTGSTGAVNGLAAATNDSGVIFLQDTTQLAVSVYVKASTRTDSERDLVIARLARAAFELFRSRA